MTEQELREKVVSIAKSYTGAKKGSQKHKEIIDKYNTQTKLPINYKVTYSDNWCAASVTAWSMMAGTYDIIPAECSCSRMIEKAKSMNIWEEKDSYVPKLGDFVMYDWNDNGVGDCVGAPEHVGIVSKVNGSKFAVMEGNKGTDSVVGERSMSVNGRYIRGYVCPNYASLATVEEKKGNETMISKYKNVSGIDIIEVPAAKFKIRMVDKKKNAIGNNICNAGFFGGYKEGSTYFTLPVGNLICDLVNVNFYVNKYCKERGKVVGDKFYFDSYSYNDKQFKGKAMTSLYVNNGKARITELKSLPDAAYAIGGVPVMRNGEDVKFATFVKNQGWDASVLYATYHVFVGLKSDNADTIYIMGMKTTTSNLIYSAEAFKKFKAMGFRDVIKLDGGGSYYLNVNGKVKSTSENRQINTVIDFGEVEQGNPYQVPTIAVAYGCKNINAVKWLQWELNNNGYSLTVDGSFGPATKNALMDYQKKHGLACDGSCGPATKKSLIG